ncbi:MAG: MltA domain-containing protein [Alphaproteobacteria bacterium]
MQRGLLILTVLLLAVAAFRFGYQMGADNSAGQTGPDVAVSTVTATPTFYDDVPGWSDDLAFDLSACTACPLRDSWGDTVAAYFEDHFVIEALSTPTGDQGLMTGYYAPVIDARLKPDDDFSVPLYGRPADLVTVRLERFDPALKGKVIHGRWDENADAFVPYADRAAIDDNADLVPIAYVRDKVVRFFLQIQGSGLLRFSDGQMMRAGYAGKNGRPYHAIGRDLITAGEIAPADMSMQAIRGWLYGNPEKAEDLMDKNPAFIFFQLDGQGLAVKGAANVPLLPDQSVAVDPAYHAYGEFLYVYDTASDTGRIVRADDTGGAIRGPLRLDLYRGVGDDGAAKAGPMAAPIRLYRLVPRQQGDKAGL